MLPTFIIALLLLVYTTQFRHTDTQQSVYDRGFHLSQELSSASALALISNDNQAMLQVLIDESYKQDQVTGVRIYNHNKQLVARGGTIQQLLPNMTPKRSGEVDIQTDQEALTFTTPITLSSLSEQAVSRSNLHVAANDYLYSIYPDGIVGWASITMSRSNHWLARYSTVALLTLVILLALTLVNRLISGSFPRSFKRQTQIDARPNGELRVHNTVANQMATSMQTISHTPSIPENHKFDKLSEQEIDQTISDLKETLEAIEIQNIELDMARKEALNASKVKSEFLTNMSHEIRTPINGVLGFTSLLMKTNLNERQSEYLNTIKKSASHLLGMIDNILDLSKLEAGKLSLDKTTFDIRSCIDEIIDDVIGQAQKKHIEIIPLVDNSVPQTLLGDPHRLKQVMANLLNNAIKFTENGTISLRCALQKDGGDYTAIKVSITDTGIGLSKEDQEKIFQAFTQADNGTARKFGGVGLGLVIAKKLLEMMDGEVGVESTPKNGSTFWFIFRSEMPLSEQGQFVVAPSLKDHKVLMYERNRVAAESYLQLIHSWGAKAYHTDSEDILLTILSNPNNHYHYILLGMNELQEQLLTAVEKHNPHHTPIIGLCNVSIAELKKYFEKHNSSATLLPKPVKPKELVNVLTNLKPITQTEAIAHFERLEKTKKILVVDDNEANLKLTIALLKNLELDVIGAKSGPEAIQLAKTHDFDLIFMDIQMPEMDGLTASQEIQKLVNNPPPIIALTAHALSDEKKRLINEGMQDYLTKPITEEELADAVKKWSKSNIKQNENPKHTSIGLKYPNGQGIFFKKGQNILSNQSNTMTSKTTLQAPEEPKKFPVMDWNLAIQLAGNKPQLAREMLTMLLEDLPGEQAIINNAYENQQYEAMQQSVHKLHGATCYCGTVELKEAAKKMETLLKKHEVNQYKAALDELNKAINNVLKGAKEEAWLN